MQTYAEIKRYIIETFCTKTRHRFRLVSCRVCEEKRQVKRKAILEEAFGDILDLLGRSHR